VVAVVGRIFPVNTGRSEAVPSERWAYVLRVVVLWAWVEDIPVWDRVSSSWYGAAPQVITVAPGGPLTWVLGTEYVGESGAGVSAVVDVASVYPVEGKNGRWGARSLYLSL